MARRRPYLDEVDGDLMSGEIAENRRALEDEYLASLPEANTVEDILRDFLDAVRHAVTLAEVNVAAGIAHQRLAA